MSEDIGIELYLELKKEIETFGYQVILTEDRVKVINPENAILGVGDPNHP